MAGLIIEIVILERKDIILCQKWDRHIDGKEGTINLLRECKAWNCDSYQHDNRSEKICHLNPEEILKAVEIL